MKHCYIVTGTTSGLGLAFIKQLMTQENVVYSISRSTNETISKFTNQKNFKHYLCDLAQENVLQEVITSIFESIDLPSLKSITLINNAGTINPIGDVGTNELKEINNSIDTNIKAPIILAEYFIKKTQLLAINKFILNISSGAGRNPYAGWASYCAAKAGLDLFTRCIGVEQQSEQYPIKAISFAPGVIDTNMQVVIRDTPEEVFESVSRFRTLKENGQLLSAPFVAHQLLELLLSNQTMGGGLYDIRDFIAEKQ